MQDHKMTAIEKRATWGLGAVFSLRMLGMFMILPVISTYGMALQDATPTLIGISIGIYGLMQALFQIPLGLFSDKINRKHLIISAFIIFILGSLIAAFSSSIWGIIIGRALQGAGAISAAIMALLSDLTREQHRTKAMALIGMSFGVTFALAMVLSPIFTQAFGLSFLFYLMAISGILAILVIIFVIPDENTLLHQFNRDASPVKNDVRTLLFNPVLMKLNLSIFCLHFLLMSLFIALPQQLEHTGFALGSHWKLYLITLLIAFAFVIPIISYAENKHRMKKTFIICITLILFSGLILSGTKNTFLYLALGLQLFFIAFNLLEAILPSLISKTAPPGYKGTAMGIYSTSQFLGVALGGSISGWLLGHYGVNAVFLISVIISLLWLILSFTLSEPPHVKSLRIIIDKKIINVSDIETYLKQQRGVIAVFLSSEENAIYLKIDSKIINPHQLQTLIEIISPINNNSGLLTVN